MIKGKLLIFDYIGFVIIILIISGVTKYRDMDVVTTVEKNGKTFTW